MKLLTVAIMLAGIVRAQEPKYEDARAAIQKRDFETAARILRPLAEQGMARAQSTLGGLYAAGFGVPQNYTEAVTWFRKAAAQGFAEGQANLGIAYENGQGVPKSFADAAGWFRKSAEQGYAPGEYFLGSMYR